MAPLVIGVVAEASEGLPHADCDASHLSSGQGIPLSEKQMSLALFSLDS